MQKLFDTKLQKIIWIVYIFAVWKIVSIAPASQLGYYHPVVIANVAFKISLITITTIVIALVCKPKAK